MTKAAPKKTTTRTPRRKKAAPELRAIDLHPFFIEDHHSVSAQTAIRVTAILACVRFVAQSLA